MMEKQSKRQLLQDAPTHELLEAIQIKKGEEEAFKALLDRYSPMLFRAVAHFGAGKSREDQEDMYQEAVAAFYDASRSYRQDQKTVEFGLYAKICVSNRLRSHLRREQGKQMLVPLDEEEWEAFGERPEGEEPSARVIEQEETEALIQLIREHLSAYERQVFFRYVDGESTSRIAGELGKPPKSIENAMARIRRKLKALLRDRLK